MIVPLYYANTGPSGTSCPSRRVRDHSVLAKAHLPQKPLHIRQGPDGGGEVRGIGSPLSSIQRRTYQNLSRGWQSAGRRRWQRPKRELALREVRNCSGDTGHRTRGGVLSWHHTRPRLRPAPSLCPQHLSVVADLRDSERRPPLRGVGRD